MKRPLAFAAALVLPLATPAADWLTLFGTAGDPRDDYVQTDPTTVKIEDRKRRILDIRVNRSDFRTSTDGIRFRSFEGRAEVDCDARTARYIAATFYSEPNFGGTPIASLRFQKDQERPVTFRQLPGALDTRIVKAACALQP